MLSGGMRVPGIHPGIPQAVGGTYVYPSTTEAVHPAEQTLLEKRLLKKHHDRPPML